jgi:hypothetical protein
MENCILYFSEANMVLFMATYTSLKLSLWGICQSKLYFSVTIKSSGWKTNISII